MFHARSFSVAAAVGLTTLLGACALQVRSDVNPRQSVATCHSYAWAPEIRDPRARQREEANPLNAERLRAAIDSNLQGRGLRPAAPGAADCMVGFEVGSHRYVDGFMGGPGWGWGVGWGWRRGYAGFGWDEPYVYREGFIAVDLYDAKTHVPLWHAAVTQDIAGLTGSKAEEKINAAVAAIFTKYPT